MGAGVPIGGASRAAAMMLPMTIFLALVSWHG
jgi:hypothetical protein